MTQADSIPGRIGPYRVLRALGVDRASPRYLCLEEGGSGSASDVEVLVASLSSDDTGARERAASGYIDLVHEGITRLLRFFVDEGRCVAVMEHVPGVTLEELVRARPAGEALSVPSCLLLARRICEAIAFAHGKGLVHGGLRASDVSLGSGGTVKVGGFGMAFLLGPSSAATDQRADVTACGRLLYRLFAALADEPGELLPLGWVRTGLSDKLTEAVDKAADPSVPAPPQCETIAAIASGLCDADTARTELEAAVRALATARARSPVRAGTLLGLSPSPFAKAAEVHEVSTVPKLALDELPTIPKGRHVADIEAEADLERELAAALAPRPAPPPPPVVELHAAAEPEPSAELLPASALETFREPVPEPPDAPAPEPPDAPAPAPPDAPAPEPEMSDEATEIMPNRLPEVSDEATEIMPNRPPEVSDGATDAMPRRSKAGRIVVGIVVVGAVATGAFYARKQWRPTPLAVAPPPEPTASVAPAPSSSSSSPAPAPEPAPAPAPVVASAVPSASVGPPPRPPANAGYLTVHTSVTSANVYVGPTKVGRVETLLTVPCGRRFVAVGLPTRKEREPVWIAPGKKMDIPCGGAVEITVQPRRLK